MPQPDANLRRAQASSGAWIATGLVERTVWGNTDWFMYRAAMCINRPSIDIIQFQQTYDEFFFFDGGHIDTYKSVILPSYFKQLNRLPFLKFKQKNHWKIDKRLSAQVYFIEQTENWKQPDSIRGVLHGLGLLERFDDTSICFLSGVELGESFTDGLLNIPSLKHDPLPIRISSEISTAETEPCWVSGYPVKLFERNLDGRVVINAIPITRGYLGLLTYLFNDSGCERGALDLNQWKPVFFRPIFWQAKS